MIESGIIAMMLIWIIGEIQYLKRRLKKGAQWMIYLNHKMTAIESKLRDCGIELLEELPPPPEINLTPPPLDPDPK